LIDLPASALWLPPKPAIVRASTLKEANFLPGMFPAMVMAGDRPPVTVERTDSFTQVGAVVGESFFEQAGVSFGDASSDRIMVASVFAHSRAAVFSSGEIASVLFAGNSATRAGRVVFEGAIGEIAIYYLAAPSGTTGTVRVNMVDEAQTVGVQVYAVRGPVLSVVTTTGGNGLSTNVAGSHSLDQTTIKGAGLVGIIAQKTSGDSNNPTTLTWTGLGDPLTTNFQIDTAGGMQRARMTGAYESALAVGQSPRTITASWADPPDFTYHGSVCAQFQA
jgi:hypothetical protein